MDAQGVKAADMASATGIPYTTLSSLISRDSTKVDIDVLIKICNFLDCSPEDFSSEVPKSKTHFSEMIEKYSALDSFGKEAVDAIINIEYNRCTNTVKVFKAAHSSNNEPPKVVNVPKSLIEKLENAPDSDDEGL